MADLARQMNASLSLRKDSLGEELDSRRRKQEEEEEEEGRSREQEEKQEEEEEQQQQEKQQKQQEQKQEEEEEDKDVAILTNILQTDQFSCCLAADCLLGDPALKTGNKKMEYKARQWHEKCFCCCVCKTPIGTKSFIPRDQEIYCAACYEEKFATRCVKCSKIITSGGVTYKNDPWHRECFTCTNCEASLAGQRFTSRDDKPYCADCFGELFAKRCTACARPITGIGGTRFISFEDRHWHNDCFVCASCTGSLVGKGFITDGADILCPECAKQKLM